MGRPCTLKMPESNNIPIEVIQAEITNNAFLELFSKSSL